MLNLNYLQVELTGRCKNRCPLCLPPGLKTGTEMTRGGVALIARQVGRLFEKASGKPNITFAGYGNPVESSVFAFAVTSFAALGCPITATCRVKDIPGCRGVDRLNVSVDSVDDAEHLLRFVNEEPQCKAIVPHVVLAGGRKTQMDALRLLVDNCMFFEKISVARAVILCDDPDHVETVSRANSASDPQWRDLRSWAATSDEKLVLWDEAPRSAGCAWKKGGLLIDSNLKVLPCCNLPCVAPMADLHATSLESVLKRYDPNAYREHCEACPRTGGVRA